MKVSNIDFEKYKVFNDGRIWSNFFKKFIKPQNIRGGYLGVCMVCKDGKIHPFKIHRIIAELFCDIPKHLKETPIEKLDVDHINGDRTDNRMCNLRWCTRKENTNFELTKKRRSVSHQGTVVPNRWKKIYQFTTDGELVCEYESVTAASQKMNLCKATISQCLSGRSKTAGGYVWKTNSSN